MDIFARFGFAHMLIFMFREFFPQAKEHAVTAHSESFRVMCGKRPLPPGVAE
ncbi:MAG: hypothetical protein LOY03_12820 [Cyclobacteriaceae bacterium]|jgi:hypothetical protein|nr:hypothetical protein [Cyclobacteriaceae bacterium]